MILQIPEISRLFNFDDGTLQTLVIENQKFLFRFLTDLVAQCNGQAGEAVLSKNDTPLDMSKNVELLDSFVPFDINRKGLLTKITSSLETLAINPENFEATSSLLADIERHLNHLSFLFPCDLIFPKLSAASLIKSASPEIVDDSSSLPEKLLNYMELVQEFDRKKLFVTVNLRSYITDQECELFAKTVLSHGFSILMVESAEHPRLSIEKRTIMDQDCCEIS